jgi:hypothetical protein
MDHSTALRPSPASPARAAAIEPMERRLLFSVSSTLFPALATADFNDDGAAEVLVIVRTSRARLADLGFIGRGFRRGSVLLLDDAGGLVGGALPLRFGAGATPQVEVADFNSDGQLDLLVSGARGAGRRGLSLLTGNGDGTFDAAVPVTGVPGNIASLDTGDFNGDGRTDLVVTTRSGRTAGGFATSLFDPFFRPPQRPAGVTPAGGAGVAHPGVLSGTVIDINERLERSRAAGATGASAEAGAALLDGATQLLGVPQFLGSPFFDGGDSDDVGGPFVFLGNGDGTFRQAGTTTGGGDDDDGDDDGGVVVDFSPAAPETLRRDRDGN